MAFFVVASNPAYRWTGRSPNSDLFSYGLWFRLGVDAAWQLCTLFRVYNTDYGRGTGLAWDYGSSGRLLLDDNDGNTEIATLERSKWYWAGVTVVGALITASVTGADGGHFVSTATRASNVVGIGLTDAMISDASSPHDGDIVNVKVWSGVALSPKELEEEQWSYAPIHHADHIWACKPLINPRNLLESEWEPHPQRSSWVLSGTAALGGAAPRGLDISTAHREERRPIRGVVTAAPTTWPAALLMQL